MVLQLYCIRCHTRFTQNVEDHFTEITYTCDNCKLLLYVKPVDVTLKIYEVGEFIPPPLAQPQIEYWED